MFQEAMAAIPLASARWVAFDVETTGLSSAGDRVIEIGAVKFSLDGAVDAVYQQLVNPCRWIPARVVQIHGITSAMVRSKPMAAQVLPGFLDFLEDADALLAHNAGFDAGFIAMECARAGLQAPAVPILDTVTLGRSLLPGLSSYKLTSLAQALEVSGAGHHRAVADSQVVREIFCSLLRKLPQARTIGCVAPHSQVHTFQARTAVTSTLPPGYEVLSAALLAASPLAIIYDGGRKGTEPRTITPRTVYRQGGVIHLTAFCHIDRVEKNFRLDRIRQCHAPEVAGSDQG